MTACLQINFCLPTTYPVSRYSFNYAPVAVGIVLIGAIAAWFFPAVGARHWYHGPKGTYARLDPRWKNKQEVLFSTLSLIDEQYEKGGPSA